MASPTIGSEAARGAWLDNPEEIETSATAPANAGKLPPCPITRSELFLRAREKRADSYTHSRRALLVALIPRKAPARFALWPKERIGAIIESWNYACRLATSMPNRT
jgi:hypothetical protein